MSQSWDIRLIIDPAPFTAAGNTLSAGVANFNVAQVWDVLLFDGMSTPFAAAGNTISAGVADFDGGYWYSITGDVSLLTRPFLAPLDLGSVSAPLDVAAVTAPLDLAGVTAPLDLTAVTAPLDMTEDVT